MFNRGSWKIAIGAAMLLLVYVTPSRATPTSCSDPASDFTMTYLGDLSNFFTYDITDTGPGCIELLAGSTISLTGIDEPGIIGTEITGETIPTFTPTSIVWDYQVTYDIGNSPGFTPIEIQLLCPTCVTGDPEWDITDGGVVSSGPIDGPVTAVATTPEPATVGMLLMGMVGLGLIAGLKRYREDRLATAA